MTLLFTFPDQEPLAHSLKIEQGKWEWRHFPDGESYVHVLSQVHGKPVIILCSLDHPDEKTLPLLFLASTLRELGVASITLVAPYLGYMRQDKRFKDGEAVTSEIFAKLVSPFIDSLITIDPHLHRHVFLVEIYRCVCQTASASPLMASWIKQHVEAPVIIGPDKESEQWVKSVAAGAGAPSLILEKTRRSDRDVEITLPGMEQYRGKTPVIVDDIISTAGTMIKTVTLLHNQGFTQTTCLATHGLFAGDAYAKLTKAGAAAIVTANTIPHASNAMDIGGLLAPLLS